MTPTVSRPSIVATIIAKDLREYGRDRLWAFLTALVLVAVIALFWVLPNDVDESIAIGISGLEPSILGDLGESAEQGLRIVPLSDADELAAVVAGDVRAWSVGDEVVVGSGDAPEGGDELTVDIGLSFPADFLAATAAGETGTVEVLIDAAVPPEYRTTVVGVVRELAFQAAGRQLPVSATETVFTVLGEDRVGDQVSTREGMRPLFVFLVLVMEMFAMSALIAREIQDKTMRALLVTPARIGDVLVAKGVAGTLTGLAQAAILLAAIGSWGAHPGLALTLITLGAILVSGVAMIAGSAGKDFIGTLFYGMVFMIPLIVPAFAALFPGTASPWVRALPSYPLIEGLVETTIYGQGWAESWGRIGVLAAWCAVVFGVGWVVLRRRVVRG